MRFDNFYPGLMDLFITMPFNSPRSIQVQLQHNKLRPCNLYETNTKYLLSRVTPNTDHVNIISPRSCILVSGWWSSNTIDRIVQPPSTEASSRAPHTRPDGTPYAIHKGLISVLDGKDFLMVRPRPQLCCINYWFILELINLDLP